MELLTTIVSFSLLLGLILVPIFLFVGMKKWYRPKFGFLAYLISGLIITAGIIWAFAWWAHYSDELLMNHFGYDFDPMNDIDRFENVDSENLEKVKQLEIGYFGIGWSLKAIMMFVLYSPYLLIVYFAGQWIKRNKKKHLTRSIFNT